MDLFLKSAKTSANEFFWYFSCLLLPQSLISPVSCGVINPLLKRGVYEPLPHATGYGWVHKVHKGHLGIMNPMIFNANYLLEA